MRMLRDGCWRWCSSWTVGRGLRLRCCAGWDRQTLRDWVHRYNAEGLKGLSARRGKVGPKPRLSPEQRGAVAELVRAGPELAQHGVVRWRRVDLAAVIKIRFGVMVVTNSA